MIAQLFKCCRKKIAFMARHKYTLLTSESQEAHIGVEESHRLCSHADNMLFNDQIMKVVWFKVCFFG